MSGVEEIRIIERPGLDDFHEKYDAHIKHIYNHRNGYMR